MDFFIFRLESGFWNWQSRTKQAAKFWGRPKAQFLKIRGILQNIDFIDVLYPKLHRLFIKYEIHMDKRILLTI